MCVSLFEPASLWIIDECKRPQHPGVVPVEKWYCVHIHLKVDTKTIQHVTFGMCVLILLFGVSSSVDKKADTVDGV